MTIAAVGGLVTATILLLQGLDLLIDASKDSGTPRSGSVSFQRGRLYGDLKLDNLTPIYEPAFSVGNEAHYHDETLVIGVEIGGEARAYPLNILNHHEIVNDVMNGVPLLVTWCPICGTGLVHDRRINGKAHTFGNYSALYMNAMTWYDHETQSLWSQPTGSALMGVYKGLSLEMIPAPVVPWATWKSEHPNTLVLNVGLGRAETSKVDPFDTEGRGYVAGVVLGDDAKAYPFAVVSLKVVVNDAIGIQPVVVYANPADKSVHIYSSKLGESNLEFEWVDGSLRDTQTGTRWDATGGVGIEGPLRGEILEELPYSTAYEWAWMEFYPDTEIYGDE